MGLALTTPPTTTVLATSDLRSHLSLDIPDHDVYISGLNVAAESYCEKRTGRQFLAATYTLTIDDFPCRGMTLPRPPLASVSSVTYIASSDGSTVTLDSSIYQVETNGQKGWFGLAYNQSWPPARDEKGAVTITFVAGSSSSTGVPAEAKHAIKMIVGHWFEARESVVVGSIANEMPLAADSLLNLISVGEYP